MNWVGSLVRLGFYDIGIERDSVPPIKLGEHLKSFDSSSSCATTELMKFADSKTKL